MKKLAISILFCSASAFATSVTYSTSAQFFGPDVVGGAVSGNSLANAGATVTFTGVPSSTVDAPTNISLGTIQVLGAGTFTGDSIDLTISQSDPGPAGVVITSSTIDGTITSISNGIDISFAPGTLSVASNPTITYVLESSYFLVAPDTNTGVTSIQAAVTAAPEPASLGLLGGSLLALGLVARRKAVKN